MIDLQLNGKHAVVCGASRGIGRATAQALAELGARVTVVARNTDALAELVETLPPADGKHDYLSLDFDATDELRQALAKHADTFKDASILVNNAGGPKGGPIAEAGIDEFEAGFRRHLIANQLLAQAVLPGMRSAGYGRIVNIISTSVYEPIPGLGVSNTVRGAVASWAKTLSREVAPHGITVNNVLPGFTQTARLKSLFAARADKEGRSEAEVAEQARAKVPAGRFAEPEETAAAIAFLASPAAGYINGVSLPVDGGRLASI